MTLTQAMESHGHNILQLATLAGVSWRSVRAARKGQLRKPAVARKIADVYRDASGAWTVDPASMLSFAESAA